MSSEARRVEMKNKFGAVRMSLPRRDFMKSLGISIGSILLVGRLQPHDQGDAPPQTRTPTPTPSSMPQSNTDPVTIERYSTSMGLFPQETSTMTEEDPAENPSTPAYYPFNDPNLSPRARLRHCWFYLSWLARRYEESQTTGEWAKDLIIRSHRAALVELIVAGKMSEAIARDVQKGFDAAVNHIHTSTLPMVCYD